MPHGPKSADEQMMEREGPPPESYLEEPQGGTALAVQDQPRREGPRGGPRQAQNMTVSEQRKMRAEKFYSLLDKRADDFAVLLEGSNIPTARFVGVARRAVIQTKDLLDKASPESFLIACLKCASDGLEPDGQEAAFVVYGSEVQYTPMYRGLLKVAYRCGALKAANCQVIYEGEDDPKYLSYDLGSERFIRFQPPLAGRDDSKPIIGAFATGKDAEGNTWVELMGGKELAKVKAVSRAKNGPNKDWPGEMARKAPLRRMLKFVPKNPELEQILKHDDETYFRKGDPAAGHLPPPDRSSTIPNDALFGPDPHTPAAEPEAPEVEEPEVIEGEFEETAEDVDMAEVYASMTRILESLATLEEVETWEKEWREGPHWPNLGKFQRLLEGKIAMRRGELGKPMILYAQIMSNKPVKTYDDLHAWASDLLAKISAAKPANLKAFGEANRQYIWDAKRMGGQVEKSADRVIAALSVRGFKIEGDSK